MASASHEDYCLHAEDAPIETQNDVEDELNRMKMSALIKLAAEAGATEDEIEQAHEGAREAFIRLIKEKEDLGDDDGGEYETMEVVNHLPGEQATKLLDLMRRKERVIQDLHQRNHSLLG